MSRRRRSRPAAPAESAPRVEEPDWRAELARPATLLLLLCALLVFQIAWNIGAQSGGIDYYQFWVGPQIATTMDLENPYDPESRRVIGAEFRRRGEESGDPYWKAVAAERQVVDTYHSPFLYLTFAPLVSGDYGSDLRFYRHLSLLVSVTSTLVLCRIVGLPLLESLGLLIVVLGGFRSIRFDLHMGNVTQLQLGMLAAWAWIQSRDRSVWRDLAGGAVLGLAVVYKPTAVVIVAVLGISWLVVGDWRKIRDQALGAIAGAAVGLVGTGIFWGKLSIWLDFLGSLPIPDELVPFDQRNYAPAQILLDATGLHLAPALMLVGLAVTGALLWTRREALRRCEHADLLAMSLGTLVMLVTSPIAWTYYYVVTVPAIALAFAWARRSPRPAIAVSAVGACVLPLLAVDPMDAVEAAEPLALAALQSLSMLGLFALVLRSLGPAKSLEDAAPSGQPQAARS